jgi:hypothetical protein
MTISRPLRFVLQLAALVTLVCAATALPNGAWTALPWLVATVGLLAVARQPIAKE